MSTQPPARRRFALRGMLLTVPAARQASANRETSLNRGRALMQDGHKRYLVEDSNIPRVDHGRLPMVGQLGGVQNVLGGRQCRGGVGLWRPRVAGSPSSEDRP